MRRYITCLTFCAVLSACSLAQDIYTLSGGELIFQFSQIEKGSDDLNSRMRFTGAFHGGEYVHFDFGDHIGLFSGIGLRNVGFITKTNDTISKYRTYNLGMPLALKLGSFRKNLYIFGGVELEWLMHFKQKTIVGDTKTKYTTWFSRRTPTFMPSAFAGFQFPGGIQLKFRYYLDDYLNHHFKGNKTYYDYTGFTKTQVWYISISYMIRNMKEKVSEPAEVANL